MTEFLVRNGVWVCVVGMPVLGWILTEAVANWRKVKTSEHRTLLKQSMIERGMSADEIERVLAAGEPKLKPGDKHACC